MTLAPRTQRRTAQAIAAAVAGVLALAVAAAPVVPASAKVAVTPSTKVLTLKDPAINESSGLARSGYSSSRLWTHNDSGGGTTLYAIGSDGRTTARFEVAGASHKDWEGMARSVVGGVSYLYVGDIGDNGKKRPSIFVHRVKEPQPGVNGGSLTSDTYEFTYPDGRHNAEGLMVDPRTQRIYIVTKVKGANGAIYVAPSNPSTSSVNKLTRVGTAPAGMSDATFLDDGRFVLRGYVNGWLYASVGAAPVGFALPLKGESITQDWSSGSVLVGSEKPFSSIWRVQLP